MHPTLAISSSYARPERQRHKGQPKKMQTLHNPPHLNIKLFLFFSFILVQIFSNWSRWYIPIFDGLVTESQIMSLEVWIAFLGCWFGPLSKIFWRVGLFGIRYNRLEQTLNISSHASVLSRAFDGFSVLFLWHLPCNPHRGKCFGLICDKNVSAEVGRKVSKKSRQEQIWPSTVHNLQESDPEETFPGS